MNFTEQLRVLEAAHGDPARLALATVDLKYPELSAAERAVLRASLETAAIPHWCDEAILAALLEIAPEESARRLAQLRKLRVVEPFPARGETAVNVHEASRVALRKRMAGEKPERFRQLSALAANFFDRDLASAGRIEWIFHLLCAEPERGTTELIDLTREWSLIARPEDEYAMARAMKELDDGGMVTGRARAWALLDIAWVRWSRGDRAELEGEARAILTLARETRDQAAEGDAQALLGDVLLAQGRLEEAEAAIAETLAISRRLAEADARNAVRQRELAAAWSKTGDVLQAQGAALGNAGEVAPAQKKLEAAQAAFAESLTISKRLADADPKHPGRQRDLAVFSNRIGGVHTLLRQHDQALSAYTEYAGIMRRLVEADPSNADWRREFATAWWCCGSSARNLDQTQDALAYLRKAKTEFDRSIQSAPDFTNWQNDRAQLSAELADLETHTSAGSDPPSAATPS